MRALIRGVLVLVAVVCCAKVAVAAEEAVPLALKFVEGNAITYEASFSGGGKLIASDAQTSLVTLQGSATVTQSVAKVQEDGSAILETLLPRADVTLAIQGKKVRLTYGEGKVRWFTDGVEQTPPQADLSKAPLLMSPIRVTMKPDGSVTDVSFADATIMDLLRKSIPSLGSSLPMTQSAPLFPADPVAVGGSWTQDIDIPVAQGQSATLHVRRTLESLAGNGEMQMAKITGYAETKFRTGTQSITGPGGQQLSFAIPEMKQAVTSTEFFNVGAGRLVRGDYDFMFTTKFGVGIGGQNQTGAVEVRVRATVVCR